MAMPGLIPGQTATFGSDPELDRKISFFFSFYFLRWRFRVVGPHLLEGFGVVGPHFFSRPWFLVVNYGGIQRAPTLK